MNSNLCSCRRIATLTCDWPSDSRTSGTCDKPICAGCARTIRGLDICPFHRGSPPMTEVEKAKAGEEAAREAARILGVKRLQA